MTERIRTYLDDVPENVKEQISRSWGDRKKETYPAARKHGIKIEEGTSFNRVVQFELEPGLYRLTSGIVSTRDVSPAHTDVGDLCGNLINELAETDMKYGCTPIFASNVCDWDSSFAKDAGANIRLRDSVIKGCIGNDIVLTGGETANLGSQVRKKGMSWMFSLLSRYDGTPHASIDVDYSLDSPLKETFRHFADKSRYEVIYKDGMPLLHVKKKGTFLLTADGTGSKSIVCDLIGKIGQDIYCTSAMTGDDAERDGAFPVNESVGIHANNFNGIKQAISHMVEAAKKYSIPMLGSVYHASDDVAHYIMNGVMLSEVTERVEQSPKKIKPSLYLVLLYEEQRSNGISTQRNVLEETFGPEWYKIPATEALEILNKKLSKNYAIHVGQRTLGELVAQPSTPYFRVGSMMPEDLAKTVSFRVNVSSGGLTGKTRRLLEPFGLGASYSYPFESPELVSLVQMSSYIEGAKGKIPDEVAYYTWGCGNGAVVATTEPELMCKYYNSNGIRARVGGIVTNKPEISIASKCLDSAQKTKPYIITHEYSEKPLG